MVFDMEKLTVKAKVENLASVTEFIISSLEERGCSVKVSMQMELVIEEIFVNVANYAYTPEVGEVTIYKDFDDDPRALDLTFADFGTPYNPLEHKDPDTTLAAEDREIGGLGIFLVKKNVDAIDYERKDGQNILHMKKFF